MTLAAGTKLGPYEVLGQVATGGMGEVYRARDTKLDREVAIKVLPESVSRDPDVLARFSSEPKRGARRCWRFRPRRASICSASTRGSRRCWRGRGCRPLE